MSLGSNDAAEAYWERQLAERKLGRTLDDALQAGLKAFAAEGNQAAKLMLGQQRVWESPAGSEASSRKIGARINKGAGRNPDLHDLHLSQTARQRKADINALMAEREAQERQQKEEEARLAQDVMDQHERPELKHLRPWAKTGFQEIIEKNNLMSFAAERLHADSNGPGSMRERIEKLTTEKERRAGNPLAGARAKAVRTMTAYFSQKMH